MASWAINSCRCRDGALQSLIITGAALTRGGKYWLGLGVEGLRTLAFLVIVFGNQATTYTNRTRQRLWSIRPSAWLVRSSIADLLIASTLANRGIAMAPLPAVVMGGAFAGAILLALVADMVKVPLFRRLSGLPDPTGPTTITRPQLHTALTISLWQRRRGSRSKSALAARIQALAGSLAPPVRLPQRQSFPMMVSSSVPRESSS